MTEDEALSIARALKLLTPSQRDFVKSVVKQFEQPASFSRDPNSDWVNGEVLHAFGDALRIHHALSRQPLTKDRFEFAFERALNVGGIPAELAISKTNRGHDITIAGVPVSLKTEAAAAIKTNIIHISKWMELGRGQWELPLLLDMFLDHIKAYQRIFTLRCLSSIDSRYVYELVEIPKDLLIDARNCRLEVRSDSRQNPKPGYGYVVDADGALKYSLYFDGGTERKLQIKGLRKDLCMVHATWHFKSTALA